MRADSKERRPPGKESGAHDATIGGGNVTASLQAAARPHMTALLDAALGYAARGLPVFPCWPRRKNPLTEHGFKDATTDPEKIRAWWTARPDANVAIATGESSFDVLDIDIEPGASGYPAMSALQAAGLLDGHGPMIRTRSGGLHIYFTGSTQRSSDARDNSPVDFKAAGGYVLAPPSFVEADSKGPAGHYTLLTDGDATARLDWRMVKDFLVPPPAFQQPAAKKAALTGDRKRAGDDYAARTSWPEILTEYGWRQVRQIGNVRYWCRPGKAGSDTSASTRDDGGLWVWSTSTGVFKTDTLYSKFGAWSQLRGFGEDYAAAARALRAAGYGTPLPAPAPLPAAAFRQPAGSQDSQPAEEGSADPLSSRLISGAAILDEPALPPAIWGIGEDVAWAEGESLILAGPDGVGKTTVAGAIVKARLGIGSPRILGMPVTPGKRKVLYLMMDRPRQIRRALRRIFTEADRQALDDRLVLWQGPPPADLARDTGMLLRLCQAADADTVIVDSLKDAALKLSDDETGSGWNRARQNVTAAGIQIMELHHPRKEQAGNKRPAELADLFGSRWISAGAGSVIMLWGKAGDPVVELIHLKQPATPVGPWQIRADRQAGTIERYTGASLLDEIRGYGAEGVTAEAAARIISGTESPSRAQVESARYRLNRYVNTDVLHRRDGRRGSQPATWSLKSESDLLPDSPEQIRQKSEDHPQLPVGAEFQQFSELTSQSETKSDTNQAHPAPVQIRTLESTCTPESDYPPVAAEQQEPQLFQRSCRDCSGRITDGQPHTCWTAAP